MTTQNVQRFYRNKYKHCTIGMSPEDVAKLGKLPDHPSKPWLFPSRYMGGKDWFVPPGAVWADTAGYYTVMTQGVYDKQIFVHCDSEDEMAHVAALHPEVVEIREDGKLRGFYGASYVLEDVTHLHDKIMENAVALMSGQEHFDNLKKEAKEKDAIIANMKKEQDSVKAEYERMKLELGVMKKNAQK